MKKTSVFLLISGFWSLVSAPAAQAVDFPLSKYGQIQNVQSYSSNPFYNPDSPYNQRLPTPIYAQGTELNAGECRTVADALVVQQCAQRNNCTGLSYSDVRPAVVIEMSNLTDHNYLTSCVGYIQPAFEDYMKSANVVKLNGFPSAFPMGGETTEKSGSSLVLSNPFERKDPKWSDDRDERKKEMLDLQRQNGSENVKLSAETFPTTYADMSFAQRMENDKAGYEQWKDSSAYIPINIESDEDKLTREKDQSEAEKELTQNEKDLLKIKDMKAFCKKYPQEYDCKSQEQTSNSAGQKPQEENKANFVPAATTSDGSSTSSANFINTGAKIENVSKQINAIAPIEKQTGNCKIDPTKLFNVKTNGSTKFADGYHSGQGYMGFNTSVQVNMNQALSIMSQAVRMTGIGGQQAKCDTSVSEALANEFGVSVSCDDICYIRFNKTVYYMCFDDVTESDQALAKMNFDYANGVLQNLCSK